MADSDKKELAIVLPGEWALKKVFGPALDALGEDLKRLYAKGRDKIFAAGYRKIKDVHDGKQANLRVTRDVLWNGAFSDDEVCAEYFGGILASARSEDGKDDSTIQYVDVIKSLSAKQLELHYVIYNCVNKLLLKADKRTNVALSAEIQGVQAWFAQIELAETLKLRIDTDLNILWRVALLSEYRMEAEQLGDRTFPYVLATPTTFGVLLYAAAHNLLEEWRQFDRMPFGDFANVKLPKFFAPSLDLLRAQAGLKQPVVSEVQAPV